jgi:DnaJ-class molecular chaperone
MGRDYYAILGVPRNADATALTKAYRNVQAKCREISEAYDVLNDPNKRQIYDKYGEDGLKAGGGGGGPGWGG